MRPFLAELLVCPGCYGPLDLHNTAQSRGEVVEGQLQCSKCSREFPILNSIPRFVTSDAYASSFSFEWKRWQRTQFDTALRRSSESSFTASTGTPPGSLRGKLVLDAGCGAGRYMELVAQGGAEVVGVDLSLAVEVAWQNLAPLPNCHLVQADLFHLPFRPETFDFAYSIGVLHHTPDTRAAFLRLVRTLRRGGEVGIWVYPRYRLTETFRYFPDRVNEVLAHDVGFGVPARWDGLARCFAKVIDRTIETSSRFQRALTTRLPSRWLYALCHLAIPLYYLYRIPIFYPLRLVTKVAMNPDPEWRVLDTFDWYSPKFQWKHTYPEVSGWFEEAGLGEITMLPRPVAVRAKKLQAS